MVEISPAPQVLFLGAGDWYHGTRDRVCAGLAKNLLSPAHVTWAFSPVTAIPLPTLGTRGRRVKPTRVEAGSCSTSLRDAPHARTWDPIGGHPTTLTTNTNTTTNTGLLVLRFCHVDWLNWTFWGASRGQGLGGSEYTSPRDTRRVIATFNSDLACPIFDSKNRRLF
jgi:hypothetical protein